MSLVWNDDDKVSNFELSSEEEEEEEEEEDSCSTADKTSQHRSPTTFEHKSPLLSLPTELIIKIIRLLPSSGDVVRLGHTCKWLSSDIFREEALRNFFIRNGIYHKIRWWPDEWFWPDPLQKLLVDAIARGSSHSIKLLVLVKTHLDKQRPKNNNEPLFHINRPIQDLQPYGQLTMLGLAATHGNVHLVEWMLMNGAKPKVAGCTNPLFVTIKRAFDSRGYKCPLLMARLLLVHGADAIDPSGTLLELLCRLSQCKVHSSAEDVYGVECLAELGRVFLLSPDFERYPDERQSVEFWIHQQLGRKYRGMGSAW